MGQHLASEAVKEIAVKVKAIQARDHEDPGDQGAVGERSEDEHARRHGEDRDDVRHGEDPAHELRFDAGLSVMTGAEKKGIMTARTNMSAKIVQRPTRAPRRGEAECRR